MLEPGLLSIGEGCETGTRCPNCYAKQRHCITAVTNTAVKVCALTLLPTRPQVLFGPPAAITHSEQPVSVSVVRAALPSVGGSRGAEQGQEQGQEQGHEEEEDEDGVDSDEVRGLWTTYTGVAARAKEHSNGATCDASVPVHVHIDRRPTPVLQYVWYRPWISHD